jgi:hypothetical protein
MQAYSDVKGPYQTLKTLRIIKSMQKVYTKQMILRHVTQTWEFIFQKQ